MLILGEIQTVSVLKRSVAEASNGDMNAYCDGKADFVSKHEKLAIKWCEYA
jgi:hypothetical protein